MPEFMLALRAACLKLRKERENSPRYIHPSTFYVKDLLYCWRLSLSFHFFPSAGAAKKTTLVKSTNSDNNSNKSKLPTLDLTLNGLSLCLDDWAIWAVCKNLYCVKTCAQCYPLLTTYYKILKLFKRAAWLKLYSTLLNFSCHVFKNYSGPLINMNFMNNSATCIYHG